MSRSTLASVIEVVDDGTLEAQEVAIVAVDERPDPLASTRSAPGVIAPSNRVNVALPFSKMRIEEPSRELAELTAIVIDLLAELGRLVPDRVDDIENLRVRAQGLAMRLR